jgi:hypothetical protein
VSDYYELLALHRTIMEAKFHPDPDNLDIPASPLLARMSERLVEALMLAERSRGDDSKADQWIQWRTRPKAGRFWSVAVQHARSLQEWAEWAKAGKVQCVLDLLAPFCVGETTVERFIAEVESVD